MATPNLDHGYLEAQMRVFYDAPNNVVRLTSVDPDFGANGISTVIKPGTAADITLRKALASHSIHAAPPLFDVSGFNDLVGPMSPDGSGLTEDVGSGTRLVESAGTTDTLRWAVGRTAKGDPVVYSFDEVGAHHLLIAGSAGSGKSVMLANMVPQLMDQGADVWIIGEFDPWRSEEESRHREALVHRTFPDDLDGAIERMQLAVSEMERRRLRIAHFGLRPSTFAAARRVVREQERLGKDAESHQLWMNRLVIVIDECAHLFAPHYDREMCKKQNTLLELTTRLARTAQDVGIHLVMTTMYPTNASIPSVIRQQMARIGLKTTNTVASMVILNEIGLEKIRTKGVGVMSINGELTAFRGVRAPDTRDV